MPVLPRASLRNSVFGVYPDLVGASLRYIFCGLSPLQLFD